MTYNGLTTFCVAVRNIHHLVITVNERKFFPILLSFDCEVLTCSGRLVFHRVVNGGKPGFPDAVSDYTCQLLGLENMI